MAKPRLKLQGKVYGYLTVLKDAGNTKDGKSRWLVRCTCGREKIFPASYFHRGTKHPVCQSCGCMRGRLISKALTTHGMSTHPIFWIWRSMIDRCHLPTHRAWGNYGGRGIQVCARWRNSFENFFADMGLTYHSGLTLERVNNGLGYSPHNCVWASYLAQGQNRRDNRRIHTPWGYLTVAEASRKSGINCTTLLYRLDHRVPRARMFEKPNSRNRFTQ